jgi:hypothetical protein
MMQSNFNPLPLQLNQLCLDAIRCSKTSPPLAARALAMVHTATYDAWSVYDEKAISTTTAQYIKIPDRRLCTTENIRKAYSYAAYRVLMDLFWLALPPENKDMFRDFMCELDYDPDNTSLEIGKPEGVGNLMSKLVIESHYGDGANQRGTLHAPPWSDYTGYEPVNTPDTVNDLNHWQPQKTKIAPDEWKVQKFLVPHWSLVRPFSLSHSWQFRPVAPYPKNRREFKEQVQQVLDFSAGLTDEQKVIAEYWAAGPGTFTPPGKWCEIAKFIAGQRGYSDGQCIKLFFALSNALLDASVACWDCKRHYDSVRPITVIHELFKGQILEAWAGPGQGTKEIPAEEWRSYIPTPPFPEYVSGHSTFSGASATILRCFTGSDEFEGCTTIEKGSSQIEPGIIPKEDITLDWPTFTDAAKQAGMSRMYGGIHFMQANETGLEMGRNIGQCAWEKALFFFND